MKRSVDIFCFALGLAFVVTVNGIPTSETSEPTCFDVENNAAIMNASISFLIHSKECQTDGDCKTIPESAGPMVCPPLMKACMPPVNAENMLNATECLAANLTSGATEPDCPSGFRRNKPTNQCEYHGPRVCTANTDCPAGQKCMASKSQPFKIKRCYTPCDPAIETTAEKNNWKTQCGMARHKPPGSQRTFIEQYFGCNAQESICGFKQPREKLVQIMTSGALPQQDSATTA